MDQILNIGLNIGRIRGVDRFVVVDTKGIVLVHDMVKPEQIARMVYSCGQRLFSVGRKNFKYAAFLRKNNKNILIFPVGKNYLGVVKERNIKNSEVADAVMEFLNKHQVNAKRELN